MSKSNELINEKSPYLLQHVYNPVKWYPWSAKAFQKAKAEDKPVFLSIGYSTCRWCHNMKRESFEDEEVASMLNNNFVSVKVDREELPHVDKVYMSVCEALTGAGGWPLTVFMTPDKIPFFAGTYFPKENMRGRIGLKELLLKIAEKWKSDKQELIDKGKEITEVLSSHLNTLKEGLLDKKLIDEGYLELKERFDSDYGGFAKKPKFPMPGCLLFLLRYLNRGYEELILKECEKNANNSADMIEKSLDGMYRGGLYDHLGGGFYRYCVDNMWLVPHFEKMLYDNVMLSLVYLEAYHWNGNDLYKEIAKSTLGFIEREMLSEKGAFYTAIDAESEGEEGKFYLWGYNEIIKILGEGKGKEFNDFYGVSYAGNFEGKNILNRLGKKKQPEIEIRMRFKEELEKLFNVRENRVPPITDDKILTSLNALAIVCYSKAARILKNKKYFNLAKNALEFVLKNLRRQEDGRILARYREGEAAFLGNLEDYSYFAWALVEFYQVSFEKKYLNMANNIILQAEILFKDDDTKAFYKYGKDAEKLFARPIEVFDGSTPSGNSVMLYVMLKLSNLIEEKRDNFVTKAEDLIRACAGSVRDAPAFSSFFLIGAMMYLKPPLKVNIFNEAHNWNGVNDRKDKIQEFVNKVDSRYIPDILISIGSENTTSNDEKNKVFAEVCDSYSCKGRVKEPAELEKILFTR